MTTKHLPKPLAQIVCEAIAKGKHEAFTSNRDEHTTITNHHLIYNGFIFTFRDINGIVVSAMLWDRYAVDDYELTTSETEALKKAFESAIKEYWI